MIRTSKNPEYSPYRLCYSDNFVTAELKSELTHQFTF